MALETFCDLLYLELDRVGAESLGIIRALQANRKDLERRARGTRDQERRREKADPSGAVNRHHPQINGHSRRIMRKNLPPGRGPLLFETLYQAQHLFELKRADLKKRQDMKTKEECTFQPTLVANYKGPVRYKMS